MLPILQFVVPMGAEFTVRLTIAASINPEYALFQSSETDDYPFGSQSPPTLCEMRTSHNEDVLTAIMVRQFPPRLKTV